MSKIIECFDEACEKYRDRTAFYELGGRRRKISFEELKNDVARVEHSLRRKGLRRGERIMLFISPSYELLVFVMASMKLGVSLMIIDVWAGRRLIKKTFEEYSAHYIALSRKTNLLRLFFPELRKIKKLLFMEEVFTSKAAGDKDKLADEGLHDREIREREVAILTMTTGSTGRPKILLRSHRDLYHQFDLVRKNMEDRGEKRLVLNTSFMYHFVNVLKGYTSLILPREGGRLFQVLGQNAKRGKTLPAEVLFTTPDFCLDTDYHFPWLEEVYVGGAILNLFEAEKIRSKFPKARITYIYGATECNLITKTDLDAYIKSLREDGQTVLGRAVKGVNIKTDETREIMVSSAVVLMDYLRPSQARGLTDEEGRYWHKTGDCGRYEEGVLYYLGRRDVFVRARRGDLYSNPLEQEVVRNFRGVEKCALFYHNGFNYLFTQGPLRDEEGLGKFLLARGLEPNVTIKTGFKIPCDAKHHSKIDYNSLKKRTETWTVEQARKENE